MVSGGRTRPTEPVHGPGTVLAGKYRVERTLGVGGFGVVLAAVHEQLDERVAIKVLLPQAASHATAPSRFVREARAAAKIRSEHVARVKDVGTLEDGTPFMVMEYLEGEDLAALVKRAGGQPVGDVCEWVLQACEAIAEAHGLGIVHRDLKPANLFLTRRIDGAPCVKVLDFGISKLATEAGADKGMTGTAEVMGSPFYMSPEQMRSTRDVDARADVWALGTILFELLAGAPPFDGETMTGLIVAIMQEPPRDLGAYRPDVPPPLRDAVLRCMQKDPSARWQDVLQLAQAIAPFAPPRAGASLGRIAAALGAARASHGPSSAALSGGAPHAGTGPVGAVTAIPATVPSQGPPLQGAATSSEFSRSVQVRRKGASPAVWIAVGLAGMVVLGGAAFARHKLRDARFGYTNPDLADFTGGPAAGGPGTPPPADVAGSAAPPPAAVPTPSAADGDGVAQPSSRPDGAASAAAASPAVAGGVAPSSSASASRPPPPVPPLGHRPGPLRPPPAPPPGKNPPPPPTSEPAAPPPPKPPADPFGRPI